jgi:hypothetical protein
MGFRMRKSIKVESNIQVRVQRCRNPSAAIAAANPMSTPIAKVTTPGIAAPRPTSSM